MVLVVRALLGSLFFFSQRPMRFTVPTDPARIRDVQSAEPKKYRGAAGAELALKVRIDDRVLKLTLSSDLR